MVSGHQPVGERKAGEPWSFGKAHLRRYLIYIYIYIYREREREREKERERERKRESIILH